MAKKDAVTDVEVFDLSDEEVADLAERGIVHDPEAHECVLDTSGRYLLRMIETQQFVAWMGEAE